MRAIFEIGADLRFTEGEKMQGGEKSLGPEKEANLSCCRCPHSGNVFIPRQVRCVRFFENAKSNLVSTFCASNKKKGLNVAPFLRGHGGDFQVEAYGKRQV